jgi:hypothetical protein
MPYNRFRFKTVGAQLGLTVRYIPDFEPKPLRVEVRPELKEWLKPDPRYPLVSEIARREWIISTVFRELLYHTSNDITVYSGEIFNVDHSLGLEGEVDYMVALGKDIYPVPAPVVAVAEAKPNNLSTGMGQCIAEMFAAQLFNSRAGLNIPYTYGIVTTGTLWTFLTLHDRLVQITGREYGLSDLEEILGIMIYMTTPQ